MKFCGVKKKALYKHVYISVAIAYVTISARYNEHSPLRLVSYQNNTALNPLCLIILTEVPALCSLNPVFYQRKLQVGFTSAPLVFSQTARGRDLQRPGLLLNNVGFLTGT